MKNVLQFLSFTATALFLILPCIILGIMAREHKDTVDKIRDKK